jgi:predicted anti-sigma-YlaC factor YlaD
MFTCVQIRRQLPEYLFGELLPNKLPKFNDHIRTCNSCRQELKELQDTIGIIHQQNVGIEFPTELDWKRFNLKLHTRLASIQSTAARPQYGTLLLNWFRRTLIPQPAWATSLASIATLILLLFQGSIISSTFISHKIAKSEDFKSITQSINSYEQPLEQRVALTKYVFEKTNS